VSWLLSSSAVVRPSRRDTCPNENPSGDHVALAISVMKTYDTSSLIGISWRGEFMHHLAPRVEQPAASLSRRKRGPHKCFATNHLHDVRSVLEAAS
jgi:hypothetical protein